MASNNQDTAEIDPATEALILQLIAQDFGQELPQTLPAIDSVSDHQEDDSHCDNQDSDSQGDIQDPNEQWDDPGSDIEGSQASELSGNRSARPAEQEVRASPSSSDPNETTTPYYVEDHNIDEMAKRSREVAELEPDEDATGTDVPAYHADFSNNSHRPSDNASNKRAKVDDHAAEHTLSSNPPDTDYPTQDIPAAAEATDSDDEDANETDSYSGEDEDSEDGDTDDDTDDEEEEEESSTLDAMHALDIHTDDDEGSTDSEGNHIVPLPAEVTGQAATLRPVTYDPNTTTRNPAPETRIPVIYIPWPGVPGWMESYVYENSGHSLDAYGGRRRGGVTEAHMLMNQARMKEEEPVDIVLEEYETADYLVGEMVKKEEEAKRAGKGKGKAVD